MTRTLASRGARDLETAQCVGQKTAWNAPRRALHSSSCSARDSRQHSWVPRFPCTRRAYSVSHAYVFDIETDGNPFLGRRSVLGNRSTLEDRSGVRIFTVQDSPNFANGEPVYFISVADGHAGEAAAEFANTMLHEIFNVVTAKDARPILGAYHALCNGTEPSGDALKAVEADASAFKDPLTLKQRLRLAFLKTDLDFAAQHPADRSGTTFSAACLQFDHAKSPPEVAVTVGHIGDTTVILCSSDGRAHALTADHNGHLESEKARIEALGGRVELKDGKLRVQGQLEPTRGIGDLAFKRVGVYAEPDLTALVKPAREVAFLCLVTDGVKQSMTHQEIVDVVKGHRTPAAAASTLIDVAEALNVDDNKTAVVLRMEDWSRAASGAIPDFTAELRERRLAKYSRAGPGVRPREKAEDEDVSVYIGRSKSEEAIQGCALDVFSYYKSKNSPGAAKTLSAAQIRQGLKFGGFSLDDWELDPEQKDRTEQWKQERRNPELRDAETDRIVIGLFKVLGNPATCSEADFVRGMKLLGVFVTDLEETSSS